MKVSRSRFDSRDEKGVTLEVTGLGMRGEGISRKGGRTIHVRGALPGDIVSCDISRNKHGTCEASLRRIVERSPWRVDPGCEAFANGCGGCQLLDLEYEKQCECKTLTGREIMRMLNARESLALPIIRMENTEHSRNKFSLTLDGKGRPGMCREGSREVFLIDDCKQEMQANVEVYRALKKTRLCKEIRQLHLRAQENGTVGLCIFAKAASKPMNTLGRAILDSIPGVSGAGVKTYRGYIHLAGKKYVEHTIDGITYSIPLAGFFQTNYLQAHVLQRLVTRLVSESASKPVCDLYSGCGFFTLPLAKSGGEVTGIESSGSSHESAVLNAAANGIKNARFIRADVKEGLKRFKPKTFGAIVLDPPRMGCEEGLLSEISRQAPERIIYVSCSPEILIRDLNVLITRGYEVSLLQPIDMFPHTYHMETVVMLSSRNRRNW